MKKRMSLVSVNEELISKTKKEGFFANLISKIRKSFEQEFCNKCHNNFKRFRMKWIRGKDTYYEDTEMALFHNNYATCPYCSNNLHEQNKKHHLHSIG